MHPLCRHKLLTAIVASFIHIEKAEARIVAKHRIKSARRHDVTLLVGQPISIGFGAKPRPKLVFKIFLEWNARRPFQHHGQNLGSADT